nr:MAG TPA: hypothetical protein [Caudoviricetes sp.]
MPPSHILSFFILLVHVIYLSFYIDSCKYFIKKKK